MTNLQDLPRGHTLRIWTTLDGSTSWEWYDEFGNLLLCNRGLPNIKHALEQYLTNRSDFPKPTEPPAPPKVRPKKQPERKPRKP